MIYTSVYRDRRAAIGPIVRIPRIFAPSNLCLAHISLLKNEAVNLFTFCKDIIARLFTLFRVPTIHPIRLLANPENFLNQFNDPWKTRFSSFRPTIIFGFEKKIADIEFQKEIPEMSFFKFENSNVLKCAQNCSNEPKNVERCLKISILVKTCSNLSRSVQTCLEVFKLVQKCSNLFRSVQTCSEVFKMFKCILIRLIF